MNIIYLRSINDDAVVLCVQSAFWQFLDLLILGTVDEKKLSDSCLLQAFSWKKSCLREPFSPIAIGHSRLKILF